MKKVYIKIDTPETKQRAKEKEILIKIKEKINNEQQSLKKIKKQNHKKQLLKNLNMSKKIAILSIPYAITAGTMAIVFKVTTDSIPFYQDDLIKPFHTKQIYDSLGGRKYEKQYGHFESEDNILNVYSNWERQEDNTYKRIIQRYSLKTASNEKAIKIVNGKLAINDYLPKPYAEITETTNIISADELNKGKYLEAILYTNDPLDFITVKEEPNYNKRMTYLYCLSTLLAYVPLYSFTHERDKIILKKYKKDIDNKYKLDDTSLIKQNIKTYKKEYRSTRKYQNKNHVKRKH